MKKKVANLDKGNFYLKRVFWILGFIILLLILLFVTRTFTGKAIDPLNTEDPLGVGLSPDDVDDILNKNSNELTEDSNTYLQDDFEKLKNNNIFISPFFKVADPIFKAFCGYNFSFELEFFVALTLAIVLITFFTLGINIFYKDFVISLIIGILIDLIAVAGGLMNIVMPKIMFVVNKPWIPLIFFLICFLLITLFEYLNKYFKELRKQKALENLGKSEDRLNSAADKLEDTMKGLEEASKGYYEAGSGI